MRQGAEDECGGAEGDVVRGNQGDRLSVNAHGGSPLVVGGGERELERRVSLNEGAEFMAGVAAGAEDTHWYFIHH